MANDAARMIERFRRARRDSSTAVLEGFHPLKHAVRFGARIDTLVVADAARIDALSATLAPDLADRLASIERTAVDRHTFERLTPTPPGEPVIALAARPATHVAHAIAQRDAAPVVLLEAPSHLSNIGACVRVAAAAGAAALLTTGTHDPWHPAALRGSAGLHYALPVARVAALPDNNRTIVAFHPDGERLGDRELPHAALLAFGSERRGLSTGLLQRAERIIAIPMRAGVSSLSLATAVAIALYAPRMR